MYFPKHVLMSLESPLVFSKFSNVVFAKAARTIP